MRVLWISAFVLFVDQVTKVAVLNLMYRQQSIALIGDWLRLTFTENPGMAFGIQIGPPGTVSVLALGATLLIAAYIWQVRHAYLPYRISLAMIFGGALGNIVDRVFYGEILGYGSFFTGRVVDFIHVSLWQGFIPESIPVLGGAYVELFPIWNVADMAIVLGVVGVLVLYRGFHEEEMEALRKAHEEAAAQEDIAQENAAQEGAAQEDAGPEAVSDTPEMGAPRGSGPSSTGPSDESGAGGTTPPSDSAPAVPEPSDRNGTSQDDAVEPDGPRDSVPPEVPAVDDSETPDSVGDDEGEDSETASDEDARR
jgi:signal peptidase II